MHIFVYGASCGGSRVNFHESHKFPALAIPLQIQQGEIHVTHISTKREIQILDRNRGRGGSSIPDICHFLYTGKICGE